MKKAFTLIELLVVIAIIAILAAMLMPALERARAEAQKSNCRAQLHQWGLAMEMFRGDNEGRYPAWVGDQAVQDAQDGTYLGTADAIPEQEWVEKRGDPFWQLTQGGYMQDVAAVDCPGVDPPDAAGALAPFWGSYQVVSCAKNESTGWSMGNMCDVVAGAEYAYDVGRVTKNSKAGRVIMGDFQRMFGAYYWGHDLRFEASHAGGANVLFVDNSVQWAQKTHPDVIWERNQLWKWFPDTGYVPNPRMDEDVDYSDDPTVRDDLTGDEVDDIYSWEETAYNPDGVWRDVHVTDPEVIFNAQPGWLAPIDPWFGNENQPSAGGKRCFANTSPHWQYPERGVFANEGRWNAHDSRLVGLGPWGVAGGGPGWTRATMEAEYPDRNWP